MTAAPRPIRVAIVDDHPVVRDGMAALLREYPGIEIAGTAASLDLAEPLLDPALVDVLLLDIRLGEETGFQLLERHRDAACAAGRRGAHRVRAGRVRGSGVSARRRLARAQDGAVAGARERDPGGGSREGPRAASAIWRAFDPTLTTREQEIVRYIAEGRNERRDRRGTVNRDEERRGPPPACVRAPGHRVTGGARCASGAGGVARCPHGHSPRRAVPLPQLGAAAR